MIGTRNNLPRHNLHDSEQTSTMQNSCALVALSWLPCLLMALILSPSSCYISSGLPAEKQRQFLVDLTKKIIEAEIGNLSEELIEAAPEVMSAWAENPYLLQTERAPKAAPLPISGHHGRECALEAEKLMKRLVQERVAGNGNANAAATACSTEAYNAVIDGWVRSGEGGYAAQRAEQILIEMQDRFSAGDDSIQPNMHSFRAVLLAWQRAGNSEFCRLQGGEANAAQRAQRILEWMVLLFDAGANDLAKPDVECFDIVMHAWSMSGHLDAARVTEGLLVWMERLYRRGNESVRPHTKSFNEVLIAWSKSSEVGAARRAQDVLDHMQALSEEGQFCDQVKPNFLSYSAVSNAWATSGEQCSARKADAALKRMERAFRDGDRSLLPDTRMYNVCIDAWAKTKSELKTNNRYPHESARRILDRQMEIYEKGNAQKCRPDVYSYTSVIKACEAMSGSKRQRERVFAVAEVTFLELCQLDYASPNHVTYGTMLKACSNLLPRGSDRRQQVLRHIFSKACEDGYVGSMVVNRLREAASPELFQELMGDSKEKNLPPKWTRSVPKRDKQVRMKKQWQSSPRRITELLP